MNRSILFSMSILIVLSSCQAQGEAENNMTSTNPSQTDRVHTDSIEISEDSGSMFSDLRKIQESLPPLIHSLDTFMVTFHQINANFTQEELDSSFHLYVEQMKRIARRVGDLEQPTGEEQDQLNKDYRPYGFENHGNEGFMWLEINKSKAIDGFRKFVSDDLLAYAALDEVVIRQYVADESRLSSHEDWADAVLELEDRLRANQFSTYYTEFMNTYKSFLYSLMWGMERMPVLSWGDEPQLLDEVKSTYDRLIADETHKTGKIIEEHVKRMEEKDYKYNGEDQWFLTDKEVEHYLQLKH
ncbi:MAG: hypothetical protein WDZ35_00300 [Crocinitomicaceae bacterium]